MMTQDEDIDSTWQQILAKSITQSQQIPFPIRSPESIDRVCKTYPMRINAWFAALACEKGAHLLSQVLPDAQELEDALGMEDPLAEDRDSPAPLITHRYPDRVLFLVSSECAIYCRFCTRKRKIGKWENISNAMIENAMQYIADHSEIKDVLVSGGDPLLLSDERLDWILDQLRRIAHIDIIRIGSRVPGTLPQRVTEGLVRTLSRYHPLYLNLHFNHADEITDETREACLRLAEAGIPMHSQTVLLKGINDHAETLETLFRGLLKIRVKPYYLLQGDLTKGTNHFRTRVETGIQIMQDLRGRISGMAMPTYIMDLPGGGGKVPLLPEYIESCGEDVWRVRNYKGMVFAYPQARQ